MPLQPGSDQGAIGGNIKELMASGRPQPQAVAIAMDKAGKSNKKVGAKKSPPPAKGKNVGSKK